MAEADLRQRIHDEMHELIAELENLMQMPSQWNGQVEITQPPRQAFGGITFGCLIRVRADIAESDSRWLTMIHEALHCFSTERNADASLRYPGYEEGVVEHLQRLLREELLDALDIELDTVFSAERDTHSAYTDYMNALESIRKALGVTEPRGFYLELLAVPLEQRWAVLEERARQTAQWQEPSFRRDWRSWERVLSGEEY